MKKRILSLILSLSMICSLSVASISVVEAAEPDNWVKLRFYSDAALQNEITSIENINDIFYGKLTVKNFTDIPLKSLQIVLDYDESIIKLVDFSDGNVVEHNASVSNLKGNYGFIADDDYIDIYNEDEMDYEPYEVLRNTNYPKVDTQNGIVNFLFFHRTTSFPNDMTVTNSDGIAIGQLVGPVEAEFLRLRFKAVSEGEAAFSINTTYDASLGSLGYMCLGDDDGSTAQITPTFDFPSIRVGTTPYTAPQTVTLNNNRVANWTKVTGAAGYNVVVKAKREGGEYQTVHTKNIENVNTVTYTIPSDIIGEVIVEVSALTPDPDEYVDSDYTASAPVEFFEQLATPVVSWSEKTLTWNAISGAVGYEVVLKKDNEPVYSGTITETSKELASFFTAVDGSSDVYTATVKAIGADKYSVNSSEASASPITIYGSVAVPTAQGWVNNTWVAGWNASVDSENVTGYGLELYKGTELIHECTVTSTSFDFTSIVQQNGVGAYTFMVYSIGKTFPNGEGYSNSRKVSSIDKTSSKQLNPVENLVWNDRVLTWTNNNEFRGSYEIKLYKDDTQTPFGTYTTSETRYDFDSVIGTVTGVVHYRAEVVAVGNNSTYTNSEIAETDNHPFYPQLTDVTGLVWKNWNNDSWIADWDEVVGATGYEVSLYRNGKLVEGSIKTTEQTVTEYDYTSFVNRPGTYTFKVKALGDEPNYSSSSVIEVPTSQTKTIVERGTISIEAYQDAELTTPLGSEIAVGDTFYAAISINNDGDPDYYVSAFNLPVKFNKDVIKVADENNMAVADGALSTAELGRGTNGLIEGEIFENEFEPVVNENYPYIDNTNGIIKFSGYTGSNDKKIDGETSLLIIKFVAVAKTTLTDVIEFADSDDSYYDETAPAGDEFSYDDDILIFPDDTNAKVTLGIVKGALPDMAAPVFDKNGVLSWTQVVGAVGYEIVLYNGTTEVATITVDDGNQTNIDLRSYASAYGSYKAEIKAIGDGIEADSSANYSPLSNEYKVERGGSLVGGGQKPTPKPEPEPEQKPFIDIDGHWAEESITELQKYNVIDGYGDNTFRPDWGITRAEFTKMMVLALGLEVEETTENTYLDTEDHWSKDYVAVATKEGIVNGIGENMFAPDVIISREQIAAIIWRIAGRVEVANDSTYTDKEDVSAYARNAVEYVTDMGYMIGFTDNTFKPVDKTNRAQAATVILRLIKSDFFKNVK